MPWKHIIWVEGSDGNIEHIGNNGLSIGDVEQVILNPERHGTSRSSGRPMVFGYTEGGDLVCVVYEDVDDDTVYPVTAYIVED